MMTEYCPDTSCTFRIVYDLLIRVTHTNDDSEQHQVLITKEVIPVVLQHSTLQHRAVSRDKTTSFVLFAQDWERHGILD